LIGKISCFALLSPLGIVFGFFREHHQRFSHVCAIILLPAFQTLVLGSRVIGFMIL